MQARSSGTQLPPLSPQPGPSQIPDEHSSPRPQSAPSGLLPVPVDDVPPAPLVVVGLGAVVMAPVVAVAALWVELPLEAPPAALEDVVVLPRLPVVAVPASVALPTALVVAAPPVPAPVLAAVLVDVDVLWAPELMPPVDVALGESSFASLPPQAQNINDAASAVGAAGQLKEAMCTGYSGPTANQRSRLFAQQLPSVGWFGTQRVAGLWSPLAPVRPEWRLYDSPRQRAN